MNGDTGIPVDPAARLAPLQAPGLRRRTQIRPGHRSGQRYSALIYSDQAMKGAAETDTRQTRGARRPRDHLEPNGRQRRNNSFQQLLRVQLMPAACIREDSIPGPGTPQHFSLVRKRYGLSAGSADIDADNVLHPGIFDPAQISSFSLAATISICSRVLCLLKENLTVTWLGLLLIARITCEPCSTPLVQALPPEAQI